MLFLFLTIKDGYENQFQHSFNGGRNHGSVFCCVDVVGAKTQTKDYLKMARKRSASIETKVKRWIMGAIPVVIGGVGLGLLFRYFGDKPVISDAAQGLNGSVKGSSWFSFLG